VLQPGHFEVPSASGRAQDGQLNTRDSVSPMARPCIALTPPPEALPAASIVWARFVPNTAGGFHSPL
jgi:hypothetical protein